jgi:hypothetical protein
MAGAARAAFLLLCGVTACCATTMAAASASDIMVRLGSRACARC